MIASLRSEFRKLLSVRSTYVLTALVLALVTFIAFYVQGWRFSSMELQNPLLLENGIRSALNIAVFGAIVAILLMTHEYRYNTIMYTLTSSNSRSGVLLSKIIVISCYAIFLALLIASWSVLMTYLGVHLHGHSFVSQTIHINDLLWRSLFYGWSYGMAGLLLAAIMRSQVGAIAALFLLPGLIEQLLGFWLKSDAVYLPFTALSQMIRSGGTTTIGGGSLSPSKAALVFCIYLMIGWLVAWVLFLRRDAN